MNAKMVVFLYFGSILSAHFLSILACTAFVNAFYFKNENRSKVSENFALKFLTN